MIIDDLKGKAVLITGASTGIGAAVARAFGAQGARVAVHYNRSKAEAEAVAADVEKAGGKALLVSGDVRDGAAISNILADTAAGFGRIDVLINNAGGLIARCPIEEVTEELFADVININARSAIIAIREAVPYFRKQGSGNVINVTSVAARHGGGPGASLYAGAKGFISTVTHGLAKELAKDRIRVNAVSPGVVTTPFHEKYSTPQQLDAMRATIPMGRLGMPDECVGAFLYLASDSLSSYVTGQIIEVNGGQYMP